MPPELIVLGIVTKILPLPEQCAEVVESTIEDVDTPNKLKTKSILVEDGNKDVEVPEGWKRIVVMRTTGLSAGSFDVYYTSPLGKKLRSKVQVEKYCEEKGLEIDLGDIKFSHKATDKEKSSLFLKAGNDLAASIYAETNDNEKGHHDSNKFEQGRRIIKSEEVYN